MENTTAHHATLKEQRTESWRRGSRRRWRGCMRMGEFSPQPLKSYCPEDRTISYGIVQPGKYHEGGIPIVRVNNFENNKLRVIETLAVHPDIEAKYVRSRPQVGDVLITLVGSIGQVAVATEDIQGWNLARAVGLIPTRNMDDANWLYFALQSPDVQDHMNQHANTTVQTTFNLSDLSKLPIPTPDLGIRRNILAVLSALDDKIELNRRVNETLEAMAQALFRDWFVDFGPVKRKLEGARDADQILGGLIEDKKEAANLAALFPDKLGDNGLPEGWGFGTLSDLARNAGVNVKPENIGSDTPYIGLEHMPRESVALTSWETVEKVTSIKAKFECGQVLFGKLRPYFHKVGIAPLDGVASTDIIVLDALAHLDRSLIACIASSTAFVAYTVAGSTGTKMPRTSWALMKQFPIAIVPEEIRIAFCTIVDPFFASLQNRICENQTLAQTRDYLLPKLMSGQIRAGDAEGMAA
jgi:type I restriction enzyme, S subunit